MQKASSAWRRKALVKSSSLARKISRGSVARRIEKRIAQQHQQPAWLAALISIQRIAREISRMLGASVGDKLSKICALKTWCVAQVWLRTGTARTSAFIPLRSVAPLRAYLHDSAGEEHRVGRGER
jgi:uncharacterized protein YfaQ (DUF2300 family)